MPISVIIASTGRGTEIAHLLDRLARQSHRPDRVVLSVVDEADLPGDPAHWQQRTGLAIEQLLGAPGLCAQRNRALERVLPAAEDAIVLFYDDDYVPALDALENLARMFALHPDLVGCDGLVIADGVRGPGLAHGAAVDLVDAHVQRPTQDDLRMLDRSASGLYGCNMAYRAGAIGAQRFDERLPLYGWQEDVDFANRVVAQTRAGVLAHCAAFVGAHRGTKAARSAGRPLGYSQVANPVYLMRKGTLPWRSGCQLIARNLLANLARSLRPEPWVDRRGRLAGNAIGFKDLLCRRLDPAGMLRLRRQ